MKGSEYLSDGFFLRKLLASANQGKKSRKRNVWDPGNDGSNSGDWQGKVLDGDLVDLRKNLSRLCQEH